jgi:hypothetical protein
LEEIPKKPRSDKQKAAFEKARGKLAEKRKKAKENNNMSSNTPNDEQQPIESYGNTDVVATDLVVQEVTPERKVEIEPPKAPEKKNDDETRPPLWFSTFIKESRENRFLQVKRNREKKIVEYSPPTPTPTAPPPSPETPPKVREALLSPTPAAKFQPRINVYANILPKRR